MMLRMVMHTNQEPQKMRLPLHLLPRRILLRQRLSQSARKKDVQLKKQHRMPLMQRMQHLV
jgi:hypothetical protein